MEKTWRVGVFNQCRLPLGAVSWSADYKGLVGWAWGPSQLHSWRAGNVTAPPVSLPSQSQLSSETKDGSLIINFPEKTFFIFISYTL